MGGSIGFGVRWKEDNIMHEAFMHRWTNDLFWRIATPEFVNQGTELKALVAEAKFKNVWPDSQLLKKISPSEYGLVLVDFPSKSILSRNGYSEPMRLLLSGMSTAFKEELEAIKYFQKHNLILSVLSVMKMKKIPVKTFKPGKSSDLLQINLSEKLFKVDHSTDWGLARTEILNWCDEHGWETPVIKTWRM